MKASLNAVAIIMHYERLHEVRADGLVYSYLCPAGKWTNGWGHTAGVGPDTVISKDQARLNLIEDIAEKERALNRLLKVKLKQHEYDALISWIFNVKLTSASTSTLLRKINQGAVTAAGPELMRWNKYEDEHGNMVVAEGLTRRRRSELYLFQYGRLPKSIALPS